MMYVCLWPLRRSLFFSFFFSFFFFSLEGLTGSLLHDTIWDGIGRDRKGREGNATYEWVLEGGGGWGGGGERGIETDEEQCYVMLLVGMYGNGRYISHVTIYIQLDSFTAMWTIYTYTSTMPFAIREKKTKEDFIVF